MEKVVNKISIIFFLICFLINVSLLLGENLKNSNSIKNINNTYSFIVAGHAYGSHYGKNFGLYPNFLNNVKKTKFKDLKFIIFTGDIVRSSTFGSWKQVEYELMDLKLDYYFVMGNHDKSVHSEQLFKEKYGNSFYSFDIQTERFIILDSVKELRAISNDQLEFLKDCFKNTEGIQTFFVFFHYLLWNGNNLRYKDIRANSGSRYDKLSSSNYWDEVHPILQQYLNKKIYVIAGDVGANPDAIPAFYEDLGPVVLMASGMGEIADENYLKVNVNNGNVNFQLMPLNESNNLKKINYYTVENLSKINYTSVLLLVYWKKILNMIQHKHYWMGFVSGLAIVFIVLRLKGHRGRF